jgi:hypothetical protein
MQRDTFFRRATIWLATIGYALVVSGLPLPLGGMQPANPQSAAAKRLAGKDRSQPFPCMDKPCGCATAEQCFSNCCCNTPAELLAWAKANRVADTVFEALARRALGGATGPGRSCCSAVSSSGPCGRKPPHGIEADPAELCSEYRFLAATSLDEDCIDDDGQPVENMDMPISDRVVVLRAMLACGGIVAQWSAIGISLPPPPVVSCEKSTEPAGEVACHDESFLSERAAPDAPPPRV